MYLRRVIGRGRSLLRVRRGSPADEGERTVALRATLATAALAAAATLAVPAANAGLLEPITGLVLPTCGVSTQPFAGFGDLSSYFGFADNGFESGAGGWTLAGGASVGSGNEPWFVNGWGNHSLVLPAGASAKSPSFCISLLDPAVRMFARGASGDDLKVQVVFRGLLGNLTGVLNVADVQGTGAWAPTQRVSSLLALPLGTTSAQIDLTAVDGTWQVDDAFIDPYLSRLG